VAYETVQEMMVAAVAGSEGFRTGMVAVMATSGDLLNHNPHVHAIAPRGGWDEDGKWVPVPYLDRGVAERLFRGKVLAICEGLLSDERARLLMSWNHNSGYSVDASVRVEPEDEKAMERMVRYMLRPPLSLERMSYTEGSDEVLYSRKRSNGRPGRKERFDALDFLARVISQVQEPKLHSMHYLGHYSNVSRGRRRKGKEEPLTPGHPRDQEDDGLPDADRRTRRRAWARLVRRVYEVDPLRCPGCGGEMRIISVILEHEVITKILRHLARKGIQPGRAPPKKDPEPF